MGKGKVELYKLCDGYRKRCKRKYYIGFERMVKIIFYLRLLELTNIYKRILFSCSIPLIYSCRLFSHLTRLWVQISSNVHKLIESSATINDSIL